MTAAVPSSELSRFGPRTRQWLAAAGITTMAHLHELGAVAAYARVREVEGAAVTLNLLWALEGALGGLPWQVVARDHRTSLLMALDAHESQFRAAKP
jgi:DNA transformation protein